ncbi:phage portal protein [Mycolicibacterium sphagni]|uniref:phage portal protein n=1 Tax=Mycolicibacterium sphagni TaxID=1786 RepID=UPI0021F3A963|nr:phage portal protein [Mycolicibacterium sphagni]MCV7174926.1 phage portal protein [Mycolicibacterium sphagni]
MIINRILRGSNTTARAVVTPEVEKRTLVSSNFIPPPGLGVTDSFVGVREAMSSMTVYGCVRLLCDTIAALPWKAYRRNGKGLPVELNPQPAIIRQPCPGFDLYQWKWMVVASLALRGNSFHLVTGRDNTMYPTGLFPLHPDAVYLERRPDILRWFDPIYRIMGQQVDPAEMVHIRRFTMPGDPLGMSPIKQAASAIGLSLAGEEFGYRFFKEGSIPSGLLTTDQNMDDDAIERQQKEWISSHAGRRMPAFLTGGLQWQTLTISPEESQFLECCAPGTLITMADGTRKSVENLVVGERITAWDGSKLVASQVKAIGTPPVKPMVKLTTARGRELVCTADHPVLGLKKLRTAGGHPLPSYDGEWIPAGELEAGQYVRVALGNLESSSGALSEDIAYFLGAMAGDGYIRTGSCTWSSGDADVAARMSSAVEALGGSLQYKDRHDYNVLTGGSGRGGSPIRGILNESGLVGTHSHDKFVPDMIARGGPRAWSAFLSAYFDADGSIRDRNEKQTPAAYWSSTSRELLDGCQHLLAMLGINSAIYPMGHGGRKSVQGIECDSRPSWGLYVMGLSEMNKLAQSLNVAHREKRRRLAGYIAGESRYSSVTFEFDAVKTVEHLGEGQSIGVEIEGTHTHVTAGIITHNTRQYQREEIAMMYGVPPHMLGLQEKNTAWGSGIEAMSMGFINFTLKAWTSCIESVISAQLPRGQFVRFDFKDLLRGDITTRYNAHQKALQSSWMSPNEIRADEEMPPIPGGDAYLQPVNLAPLGFIPNVDLAAGLDENGYPISGVPVFPAPATGTAPVKTVSGGEHSPADSKLPDNPIPDMPTLDPQPSRLERLRAEVRSTGGCVALERRSAELEEAAAGRNLGDTPDLSSLAHVALEVGAAGGHGISDALLGRLGVTAMWNGLLSDNDRRVNTH